MSSITHKDPFILIYFEQTKVDDVWAVTRDYGTQGAIISTVLTYFCRLNRVLASLWLLPQKANGVFAKKKSFESTR